MPRDGTNNLIPLNKRSSKEKAEIQSKAGIASGKARREKKLLKDIAQAMLAAEVQTKDGKMSGGEAVILAQLQKAMRGDTKSAEFIRDTSGQKPVEKILISDISADVMTEIDDLVNSNAAVPAEPVSQVNQPKTTRKKSTPKDGAE